MAVREAGKEAAERADMPEVKKHKHILTMQLKDGKWVMACVLAECDYKKPLTPAEAWEDEL